MMGKNMGRLGRKGIAALLAIVLVFQTGWVYGESSGGVRGFVQRLYQVVLNREPDASGWDFWEQKLISGESSGAEAAYGFVFSEEYQRKHTVAEDYVDLLYRALMGREPDEGGRAFWLNRLEMGATRYLVFSGFIGSEEFKQLCASYGIRCGSYASSETRDRNLDVTAFVKRLYQECLGRYPDEGGWEGWIRQVLDFGMSGAEIARGFFRSRELTGRNLGSREYLTLAYRAVLGREPDEGGLQNWIEAEQKGSSRDNILEGFYGSAEFSRLCGQYGIEVGRTNFRQPTSKDGIFYTGSGPLVAIDAGHQRHGNSEKEPIGPGSSTKKAKVAAGAEGCVTKQAEYELTLSVALKTRDELLARGYSVMMIRESNDVDLSNSERAQMANRCGADAFVRIHANSVGSRKVKGVLTVAPTAKNPYCGPIAADSLQLSKAVGSHVASVTGAVDTGVWETDEMSGINWSEVPVTILEMGYLSHPEEDRKMATDRYRNQVAKGIADGLDAYFSR